MTSSPPTGACPLSSSANSLLLDNLDQTRLKTASPAKPVTSNTADLLMTFGSPASQPCLLTQDEIFESSLVLEDRSAPDSPVARSSEYFPSSPTWLPADEDALSVFDELSPLEAPSPFPQYKELFSASLSLSLSPNAPFSLSQDKQLSRQLLPAKDTAAIHSDAMDDIVNVFGPPVRVTTARHVIGMRDPPDLPTCPADRAKVVENSLAIYIVTVAPSGDVINNQWAIGHSPWEPRLCTRNAVDGERCLSPIGISDINYCDECLRRYSLLEVRSTDQSPCQIPGCSKQATHAPDHKLPTHCSDHADPAMTHRLLEESLGLYCASEGTKGFTLRRPKGYARIPNKKKAVRPWRDYKELWYDRKASPSKARKKLQAVLSDTSFKTKSRSLFDNVLVPYVGAAMNKDDINEVYGSDATAVCALQHPLAPAIYLVSDVVWSAMFFANGSRKLSSLKGRRTTNNPNSYPLDPVLYPSLPARVVHGADVLGLPDLPSEHEKMVPIAFPDLSNVPYRTLTSWEYSKDHQAQSIKQSQGEKIDSSTGVGPAIYCFSPPHDEFGKATAKPGQEILIRYERDIRDKENYFVGFEKTKHIRLVFRPLESYNKYINKLAERHRKLSEENAHAKAINMARCVELHLLDRLRSLKQLIDASRACPDAPPLYTGPARKRQKPAAK
jgi:hypothetical protein